MSSDSESVHLLAVAIRVEQDIVVCRQHARQFAQALGFDLQTQTRIATSVSEIARNAYSYAGGGEVDFLAEIETGTARRFDLRRQTLVIIIRDQGGGIAELDKVLGGDYRSTTGMGLGIIGARRLMDSVDIQTGSAGTTITLKKNLGPAATRKTLEQVIAIAVETKPSDTDVIAEVQRQNQELLGVMEEVSHRQDDLAELNRELEQTNAGVLALYDELETLHRVGLLLASKINLPAVMQALIEATTDLTGAEFGACYLYTETMSTWERYASAGPSRHLLDDLPTVHNADFFGPTFGQDGLVHIVDMDTQSESCSVSQFAEVLKHKTTLRSCLAVPLISSETIVMGALIFGSSESRIFSERSERIVSSIAAQAIVAVEKARLFDSVKAASEAKDKFLAMISHELRTPLNPVLSIVSSLHQDTSLPPEVREDIAVVLRNVQLEARLIDDLLDFQRIIKGNLSFAEEPVNMHAIIRSVLDICQRDLGDRSHHLKLDLDAKTSTVIGDSARLQQVLWNVLKNAIKFTPTGGTITIATAVELGAMLRVAVTDTGRGIEVNLLQGIFSAFEQGNLQGATEFGGLGLGLAIVKAFMEKHGGTVVAESPGPGEGATIILRLPLYDQVGPDAPVMVPAVPDPGHSSHDSRAVLLIDDHQDTLRSLSRLLTKRGFVVTTAANSAEGLASAREIEFDIIVSDLGLPDGSGLDLMKAIREFSQTPAIALSGYGMQSDVDKTKAAGFQAHLTKPVSIPDLLSKIERVLDENMPL